MTDDTRRAQFAADPNVIEALEYVRAQAGTFFDTLVVSDRAIREALQVLIAEITRQTVEAETRHANFLVENELRVTAEAALARADAEVGRLTREQESARVRAYRQARIYEPNMDMYNAAMATYAAAFGKPDGEPEIVMPDGTTKQPWEVT